MKQHTTPISIKNGTATLLERVSLNAGAYDENWIQQVCFENPSLLPIDDLEPTFGGMIPICRELSTNSGSVDLVYVNEYGFITIGECKLWRNPEARRKVVGQILDYAKDMSQWDYSKFETECLRSRKESGTSLFQILQKFYPEVEEKSFIDNVQNNLRKGRFLLAIIGDGIRENMEELADFLHRHGNLNFSLCLIELPIFKRPDDGELIITPRVVAKTKEIERIVFRSPDEAVVESTHGGKEEPISKSVSERVFFERLEIHIGKKKADEFEQFIRELSAEYYIISKLGRGNRLSLNLKSNDDSYNFASVQEDGEVYFYGIVTKAGELGDKGIGLNYLKRVADAVQAQVDNSYKEWFWCVKLNGKFISISEYLNVKATWKEIIGSTLEALQRQAEKA